MPPRQKRTLRVNLVAILLKFANHLIKLYMTTELKTYCSIDDKLKFLKGEGGGGTGPPAPLPKSAIVGSQAYDRHTSLPPPPVFTLQCLTGKVDENKTKNI